MIDTFTHSYAAVIGVDDNITQLVLPATAKDVQAPRDVLQGITSFVYSGAFSPDG